MVVEIFNNMRKYVYSHIVHQAPPEQPMSSKPQHYLQRKLRSHAVHLFLYNILNKLLLILTHFVKLKKKKKFMMDGIIIK